MYLSDFTSLFGEREMLEVMYLWIMCGIVRMRGCTCSSRSFQS